MKSEDPLARAERITAELRAATAEAAGVLKDLERGMKAARVQVGEYLAGQMADTIAAAHRDMRARASRYLMDMLNQIQGRALEAIASAEEAIAVANTLDVLVSTVSAEICKHTVYIDGQPRVMFGVTIGPDDEDHI